MYCSGIDYKREINQEFIFGRDNFEVPIGHSSTKEN